MAEPQAPLSDTLHHAMLKFLRQYNQWILVVGGTLLLITFLMPTAIQNCAQQSAVSGAVWATYSGGKEVTGADLEDARQELRVLELVGNQLVRRLNADKDPAHWWLLAHEATESGLVGGLGDGEATLAELAAQRAEFAKTNPNVRGTTPEAMLAELMQGSRASRDVVLMTLAKMQGVGRLVELAAGLDRVSGARLEHVAAESLLGVSGDLFVVDARKAVGIDAAVADDAALEAHFRKYADKAPPVAGGPSGREDFGYRLPDRFKLEWLVIPKSSIEAVVANAPELQTIALKKRFAQDPASFGAPADGSGTFAAFETAVRQRATEELVKQRLDAAAKFATDQLALAQRSLKRDGAYFALPADWASTMPSFAALAASITEEFGIASPTYGSTGENWMTVSELEGIRGAELGLSMFSTDRFGGQMRLPQIVAGAKELSAQNLNAPFQTNIASPAFTALNGDVAFVRMIATAPSTAATDLASAREAVAADLLALAKYSWLEQNESVVLQDIAAQGLRTAATKFGADVQVAKAIREANLDILRQFGARFPTPIPGLGNDLKAVEALVSKASKLPLTKDVSQLPLAERAFAIPAPDRLSMVFIEVTALEPLTMEQYREMLPNPQFVAIVRNPDSTVDWMTMFSLDALCKRYEFKPIGEDVAAESGATGGTTDAAAPTTAG